MDIELELISCFGPVEVVVELPIEHFDEHFIESPVEPQINFLDEFDGVYPGSQFWKLFRTLVRGFSM